MADSATSQFNQGSSGFVLASGGYDFTIRLWQVSNGACAKVCQHPESHVNALAITPDRRTIASAGYQGIRLYDVVGTGQTPTNRFDRLPKNVTCVGFNKSGQWMYSGGEDGFARIFDLRIRPGTASGGQCCLNVERPVMSMALHPTRPEIFVGVQTGSIHSMDLRSLWNEEWSIGDGSTEVAILSLSPHPSGKLLAAATSGGKIYLYTVDEPQNSPPQSSRDIVVPSNSTQPPTQGSVSQLSGRPIEIRAHRRHVLKCAFSPDGKFLATVSADKTAKIWRVWTTPQISMDDGQNNDSSVQIGAKHVCDLPHPAPHMWIWDCAWSADSQHIFTACADNVVRLWTLPPEVTCGKSSPTEGEPSNNSIPKATIALEYHGHSKPVIALAYSDH